MGGLELSTHPLWAGTNSLKLLSIESTRLGWAKSQPSFFFLSFFFFCFLIDGGETLWSKRGKGGLSTRWAIQSTLEWNSGNGDTIWSLSPSSHSSTCLVLWTFHRKIQTWWPLSPISLLHFLLPLIHCPNFKQIQASASFHSFMTQNQIYKNIPICIIPKCPYCNHFFPPFL